MTVPAIADSTSSNASGRSGLMAGLVRSARRTIRLVTRRVAPRTPILPPSPFGEWTYDEASDAIAKTNAAQSIDPAVRDRNGVIIPTSGEAYYPQPRRFQNPIAVNRAFFEGDHWQEGTGWVGPHPKLTEKGYGDAMQEIALAFTSKNVVKEIVERHAAGVVGRMPQWSFVPKRELNQGETPNAEELQAIKEATALLTNWLKARKAHKLLFDAVCTVLFAERGPIRLYVPPGRMKTAADGTSFVDAPTVAAALAQLWIDHPKPEESAVIDDDETKLECGVRMYSSDIDDDDHDELCAELSYLNTFGQTVIRHVDDDDIPDTGATGTATTTAPVDDDADASATLDLGGRLPMHEIHRTALVTPQVQQNQRALNLAISCLPRTIITAGFLERVLLNAQLPGTWEVDADGKRTGRFIPGMYRVGAGTTNWITGVVKGEDENGNLDVAEPDVRWRDPVNPEGTINAAAAHYYAILEEVRQLHAIMSGDANASGKSREEARAEYLETLLQTEPEVEAATTFLLEGSLAFAEALARVPGKYTSLIRAVVSCRIYAGPLSAEEIAAIQSRIGQTLSADTAMSMLGVDDVAAEKAKMASDPHARAALALAQGQALYQLTQSGAALVGAAESIGMTPEAAKKLLDGQEFEQPTDNAPTVRSPGRKGTSGEPGSTGPADGGNPTPPKTPDTGGSGAATRQTSASGSAAGGSTNSNANSHGGA